MLRILEITVPVFGIILVAYLYGRFRPTDMATANRLNVHLFTPALIFFVLSERMGAQPEFGMAALGATAIVLGSGLLSWPASRLLGWDWRTLSPPAMFNNSGNLGLPLAVLAYGDDALPIAVVLFVVANVLHFTVGIRMLAGRTDLRQLFGNPMVVATAVGLAFMLLDLSAPALLLPGIEMLADVAIPLMLVSLGMRLTEVDLSEWRIGVVGGLLAPATGLMVAVPWVWVMQPEPMLAGLLLLFGTLPPAVLNYILAEHYHQEPVRVASIVAIGNAMALITVPLILPFVIP